MLTGSGTKRRGGQADEKVSDGYRKRERENERRSNSGRCASDYQRVSDAPETVKEEEWTSALQEKRGREK